MTGTKCPDLNIAAGFCFRLALLLMASCSVQPPKANLRFGADYQAQKPTIDRVGLFVDGLVRIEGFASRHFDVRDSATAITWTAREAEAALKAKGYDVAFVEAPFVGGYQPNGPLFSFAASQDATNGPGMSPSRAAGYLDSDPEYRDALLATSHNVLAAVDPNGTPPGQLQSDQAVRAAFMRIAIRRHIRFLFIVQDAGVRVTKDYFATEVGLAILVGHPETMRRSFLNSYASMIDLQTGELIWSNWLAFPIFDPTDARDYQSQKWAWNLFYWLPARGALEVSTK